MVTIRLKGREIPLIYTTYEMKTIQEEIAPLGKAIRMVLGRNPEDEEDTSPFGGAEHIGAAAKMIRILGNAGLEETGEVGDLTDKKVLRALRPADLAEVMNACMTAMNEGMASEIPEKEETGPVDVTLEQMKKKETKES